MYHPKMRLRCSLRVLSDGTVSVCVAPASAPRYMVIDVETDGVKGGPFAVSVAFVILDASFCTLHQYHQYLRMPPGRRMNPHSQRVHGIKERFLSSHGSPFDDVMAHTAGWVRTVQDAGGILVMHGAASDASTLNNSLRSARQDLEIRSEDCLCTCKLSKPFAGLLQKDGKPKLPTNSELYLVLHGELPAWARIHDALDDVRVTCCNLARGVEKGWFAAV